MIHHETQKLENTKTVSFFLDIQRVANGKESQERLPSREHPHHISPTIAAAFESMIFQFFLEGKLFVFVLMGRIIFFSTSAGENMRQIFSHADKLLP